MNVNSLAQAIRERDEARAQLSQAIDENDVLIAANEKLARWSDRANTLESQLSEAVALLRRFVAAWDHPTSESVGMRCDTVLEFRAFLARLDGAK